MNKKTKIRILKPLKGSKCNQHYQIGKFAQQLDRQQDAADIKKTKFRSVPADQLPMIF
ncbi:hypothetical protein SAMN04488132_10595 [Sediminibacterium ginsengisoli]|uniref:Uncharacterized protein n=1 Tax=Sediminibacterium ginsengisoli TaxID=413434 RepID=A0A1T4P1I3_9BACT|nr:hypothetical protein SAMN04488132_10595 [Sediminibacterium ginsengisoli]